MLVLSDCDIYVENVKCLLGKIKDSQSIKVKFICNDVFNLDAVVVKMILHDKFKIDSTLSEGYSLLIKDITNSKKVLLGLKFAVRVTNIPAKTFGKKAKK